MPRRSLYARECYWHKNDVINARDERNLSLGKADFYIDQTFF